MEYATHGLMVYNLLIVLFLAVIFMFDYLSHRFIDFLEVNLLQDKDCHKFVPLLPSSFSFNLYIFFKENILNF